MYGLALITLALAAQGAFADSHSRRFGNKRHRASRLAAAASDELEARAEPVVNDLVRKDACTLGSWQCVGSELQWCYNNQWNIVQNCTGQNVVCSADPNATGCIYTWQVPDDSAATTTVATTTSPASTGTAQVASDDSTTDSSSTENEDTTGDDDEGDDGEDETCPTDDETESTTSSPAPTSSVSASVVSSSVSSASASASVSALGGDLFANGGKGNNGNNGASSSMTASSTSNGFGTNATSSTPAAFGAASGSVSVSASSATATTTGRHGKSKGGQGSSVSSSAAAGATPHVVSSGSGANGTASTNTTTTTNTTTSTSSGSSGGGSWSAPHYVIYADEWLNSMPSASDLSSYNRFVLSFWMTGSGAVDDAQAWTGFSASTRQSVLDEYHAAGIALMVSAFGSTDAPTSNGADPTETAQNLAAFVKQWGFDGVDIDYEDMDAMNSNQAEAWLITFQTELRNQLGSSYLISHAPVAPWFTSASVYASGAYVQIFRQVGDTIDFFNVQFYNQGDIYMDCTTLMTKSGSDWPSTSVMEINSYTGVPLDKIVLGKPLDSGAASNGYMDPSSLAQCVAQGKAQGWPGSVMYWEWTSEATSVIETLLAAV